MSFKDWILLLVPIFCNGVFVFSLQKMHEKKQLINSIKYEYASILREKIDISLKLHAKATRLANEDNNGNDGLIAKTIQEYVDSVLDVYYYDVQNKIIFNSLDSKFELLSAYIMELTDCSHKTKVDLVQFSSIFNKIRDELMDIKNKCINLVF